MPVPVLQRRGKLPTKFLGQPVPTIILHSGEAGLMRFLEFFTARIRNKNTRLAYAQAIGQFLGWSDKRQLRLVDLKPGGTLENAQAIAAQESSRTTKLCDRTQDAIALDEVEKIQI